MQRFPGEFIILTPFLQKTQSYAMPRKRHNGQISKMLSNSFLNIRPSTLLRFYQALSFSQENISIAVLFTPSAVSDQFPLNGWSTLKSGHSTIEPEYALAISIAHLLVPALIYTF
jgi:hypothetical protein